MDLEAALVARAGAQLAAVDHHALAHADEAVAVAGGRAVGAGAAVGGRASLSGVCSVEGEPLRARRGACLRTLVSASWRIR